MVLIMVWVLSWPTHKAITPAYAQTPYNATNVEVVSFVSGGGTTTGPSNPFVNFGQCSSWLNVKTTGTVTSLQMELEGTVDDTTWFAISNVSTSTTSFTILAGGYWPHIRANILAIAGAGATVHATYSASTFCSVTNGGLTGGTLPSQPVTYVPATGVQGSASFTSPINFLTSPPVIFAGNVDNPNGVTVWIAIGASVSTATFVQGIPANAVGQQIYFPVVGQIFSSGDHIFCTNSLSVPADPGSACNVRYSFKPVIFVNGNVNISGAQVGGKQPANPTN